MQILTVYSPEDSGFYRLWERSWRLRGWEPGIITPKEIFRYKTPKAAAKARGATLIISPRMINLSFKRPRKTPTRIPFVRRGSPGWEKASVVLLA